MSNLKIDILKTYKKLKLEKGTILFRKAKDNHIYDNMFFAFDVNGTYSSDYIDSKIQIWKTRKNILVPLIARKELHKNYYINDIEELYYNFCSERKYYLDIKSRYNPLRKDFLNFLLNNGIQNWITSVHNTKSMELFLFSDQNSELVFFERFLESSNDKLYNYNSFEKIYHY